MLHADLKARDSLALDLMEAIRPEVDAWLCDALTTRTFRKVDFFETREGNCRLMPPLAKAMAELGPHWVATLGPVVEEAARFLARSIGPDVRLPTRLTETNRRAGRSNSVHPTLRSSSSVDALPAGCRECGVVLDGSGRTFCNDCRPERRAEQVTTWTSSGREALSQLRQAGIDPAHSAEAGQKRGKRNARHNLAAAAWERTVKDSVNGIDFNRDILPGLRYVPLRLIAHETGLSESHCSFVRRGLRVPHHRHWSVLAELGSKQTNVLHNDLAGTSLTPKDSIEESPKTRQEQINAELQSGNPFGNERAFEA